MSRRHQINFRGQSVLLLLQEGRDRDSLASVLGRLGLGVEAVAPHHFSSDLVGNHELMVIDGDDGGAPVWPEGLCPDLPLIALIGSEAPRGLIRLIEHGCDSHILKPVRNSGVYSALILARHAHDERRRAKREIDTLRQRLAGRRLVVQAILKMMQSDGIDDAAAYELLRQTAMNERAPIEEIARRRIVGPDPPPGLKTRSGAG
jgi:hypothetical protein